MKLLMRWAGTVFGLCAFVLLVIIAWGTALPISHSATCTAVFREYPYALFLTVNDDAASAAWRSDIASARRVSGGFGPEQWVEVDKYGHAITYATTFAKPGVRLVRTVEDRTLPYGGSWTYDFAIGQGGTVLAVTENGEIYNPVFRLLSRYFLGYTSRMRQYLSDLGKHFGEKPHVECGVISPG